MKKSVKQSAVLNIRVSDLVECIWKCNIDKLPANKTYQLVIDYPFDNSLVIPIKTGKNGMGLIQLLKKIGQVYDDAYTNDSNYYHTLEELYLEGITVDHKKKTIKLDVGS